MAEKHLARMIRLVIPAVLLTGWLILGACSTPAENSPQGAGVAGPEAQAAGKIRELVQSWAADLNRGNAAAAASIYAPDVLYMPPGQPALQGREKVQEFLDRLLPGGRSSFSYSSREIQVSGGLAYERGVFVMTLTQDGAASQSENGNLLRLFQLSADGAWQVTREIWNVSLTSAGTERQGASSRQ